MARVVLVNILSGDSTPSMPSRLTRWTHSVGLLGSLAAQSAGCGDDRIMFFCRRRLVIMEACCLASVIYDEGRGERDGYNRQVIYPPSLSRGITTTHACLIWLLT
jgi:hypothetical protein